MTPPAPPALWHAIRPRTLEVISSDHSGWSFGGPRGKRAAGEDAPFTAVPNGVPGLAARLPLLWSLGVAAGHITPSDFVRLTAPQPAACSACAPRAASRPAQMPTSCCGTRLAGRR